MKSIFFCTGYPRSKTAWLATLLTWGDCFCFHDGLANIESLDELDEKFDSVPGTIVGNSDPANLLFYEPLKERYPQAKWIVIERDLHEVKASCAKAFGSPSSHFDWNDLENRMAALKKDWYCVPFENLNLSWTLQDIFVYIGIEMPEQRLHELMRLNVQVQSKLLNVSDNSVRKMIKLHECVLA